MKLKIIAFLIIIVALSACHSNNTNTTVAPKHKEFKDSLTYTYKTVKERSKDCGNGPDSACTVAQFTYQVFKGRPALNDTVNRTLIYFFNADKHPDTSLRDCDLLFLKAYDVTKKNKPNVPPFKLNGFARVISQDSSLTTLQAGVFVYMGIDVGHTIIRFINWDRSTNKKLTLDDLLVNGNSDQLSKIAESIFRKNENLGDTASFQPKYHFRNNKFWLTDNFLVTAQGLVFYYNRFQLTLERPIQIVIPYDSLKTLMKPNTVLAQFIKH